ncbi:hypothetical protein M1K46_22075 [Fictibacillus sp. WQ 8-8]|uniref:hypothetical protein n=1 Tax=unclassified Fictibacillus TaxID=2644029 RepID=UPI0006A7E0B9|nr:MULTISPECIES: hypothetical protein [unclassified Fictibacillus]MCQ6268290.1 hypothetical protein [Fictibacillus sp. WQ 8-8]MED2972226.1 hypothetical protein [Fictibacillus sp. B-59209]UZJ78838.1 hypothetical protein OKX00_22555 [Fictibacillus sp. KU28468]SFF08954.1 hypothetical protein SAMN05428981_11524 [Bacillus sp. OV194]
MYAAGVIDEAKIPSFKTHEQAKLWFKEKYGDAFQLSNVEPIDGQQCYSYVLILDVHTYIRGQADLKEHGIMKDALKYLSSHQSIYITDDGSVHFVN